MKNLKHNTVAAALGAVVVGSLATLPASADASPFAMQDLAQGYQLATFEGKCGEGKCGGKAAKEGEGEGKGEKEGKCGEGKCGADKKAMKEGKCGEGKCGADKKAKKEGKCGEGKCGGNR